MPFFDEPGSRENFNAGIQDVMAAFGGRPGGNLNRLKATRRQEKRDDRADAWQDWQMQYKTREMEAMEQKREMEASSLAQQGQRDNMYFQSLPESQRPAAMAMGAKEHGKQMYTDDYAEYQHYLADNPTVPKSFDSWLGDIKQKSAINIGFDSSGKFDENYAKLQAGALDDSNRSATAANQSNEALQRFVESSSKATEGFFANDITSLKNMFSSFNIDTDGLFGNITDATKMQQSIAEMKVQLIAKFGARGLTDKDMEIIDASLPKLATSHKARMAVSDVLVRNNNRTISENIDMRKWTEENVYKGRPLYSPPWQREWAPYELQVPEGNPSPQVFSKDFWGESDSQPPSMVPGEDGVIDLGNLKDYK